MTRHREDSGFTLIEMLMALVLLSIVMGLGFREMRQFNETTVAESAAEAVAADITLARSYAIQRRSDVSLAADEAGRSYAIRDEGTGDTLLVRSYSASSDLPLTLLDVKTADDDLTFNARGLLTGGGSVDIELARFDSQRFVKVTAAGRTRITTTP